MATLCVVDIDGTVCDSTERTNSICEASGCSLPQWGWREFEQFTDYDGMMSDKLMPGAKEAMSYLCNSRLFKVIFLTSRSELGRGATRQWLTDILGMPSRIPLLMRKNKDTSSNRDCKSKAIVYIKQYKLPIIFFEDDETIFDVLSPHGLVLKAPECWKYIVGI
jgi:hypothetical protein